MIEADSHTARGDRLAVHGLASLLRRRRWLVVGAALISTAAFCGYARRGLPVYLVARVLAPAWKWRALGGLGGALGQDGGLAALAGLKRANRSGESGGESKWLKSEAGMQSGYTSVAALDAEHMRPRPLWMMVTTILYNLAVAVATVNSF